MNLAEKIDQYSMPEPNSGCYLWLGAQRNSQGYGSLRWKGRTYSAHRAAWIANCGAVPSGRFVCHRCDNAGCVNPSHLFLGTHAENMADMRAKGRQARPKGERQGGHKLTDSAVREILSEPAPLTVARSLELAARYGISRTYVYDIRAGISWGHISGKRSPRKAKGPLFDRLDEGR